MWNELITKIQEEDDRNRWYWRLFKTRRRKTWQLRAVNHRRWE
jgi:hypothetical protein